MYQRKDKLWADSVAVPGQSRPKYFYGKTKAEVKQKIAAFQAGQDSRLTVEGAVNEWLAFKKEKVTYKTIEGYKAPVKRILDSFGNEYIKDISPAQVQAFVNNLAQQGFKRSTVQRPLDVLRMVFNYHITQPGAVVKYNPCESVKLPSGLKQEIRDLASRDDVAIVKKSLHLPFGLFAYTIMYAGLRDGEALALTYNDFDFDAGIIYVSKNVSWQSNKPVIKSPKTENGIRQVPLLAQLKKALPKKWEGYLFSADGGKTPLTNTEFRHRWNKYCKSAGLADCEVQEHKSSGKNNRVYKKTVWKNRIVPYQLRHEFATLCYDAGLDPKSVGDIMGHADDEMVRKIYAHIQSSRRKKDASILQSYVDSLG